MYPKQSTLYLTPHQNLPNIPENAFVLNNTIIKRTGTPTDSEQMKFLGLRLDEKLTMA